MGSEENSGSETELNNSLQREMNEVSHVKPNPQSEAQCGTLVGNGIVG